VLLLIQIFFSIDFRYFNLLFRSAQEVLLFPRGLIFPCPRASFFLSARARYCA